MKLRIERNNNEQWPITVTIDQLITMRESKEITAWCYQTYGNHELSLGWYAYRRSNTQFCLLNEKDLEMFILKWG